MNNKQNKSKYDSPDSPRSVGYTSAIKVVLADPENPFSLETGTQLNHIEVEYEAYGTLNAEKTNAILVAHALSGDAHAAGWDAHWEENGRNWNSKKPGWWDSVIGPGKALDTNKFFVICSNVLGSCFGTTGPMHINPDTGKYWGMDFPVVTVGDWVNLQARLLDSLAIEKLYGIVGGSLGGQQVIEWSLAYPNRVENCAVLATAPRLSVQGVAFNAVGRHSIMNDSQFNSGQYYEGISPEKGLAVARMLAHITYLSEEGMQLKFGRRLQDKTDPDFDFGIEFQVESYLNHQGRSFVERFDANSYLYITRAMDYYDAAQKWGGGDILKAVERIQSRMLVMTFSTDWLYSPEQGRELAEAVASSGKQISYVSVDSDFGHDAFLVEVDQVSRLLSSFFHRSFE